MKAQTSAVGVGNNNINNNKKSRQNSQLLVLVNVAATFRCHYSPLAP